ncbi:DNA translocase FtsK [bacterium]|nr:DNA translocase FtsK [bacterium]
MSEQSKFLPDSVAGALKKLAWRVAGAVTLGLGAWLTFALMFHNPYLTGFAAAGNMGTQSIIGNVVGVVRYLIGFMPALFVFLCVARRGFVLMLNMSDDSAPEYNLLKGFIAVCAGAAGFGLLVPSSTFGGLAGACVATDISALVGGWTVLFGILFLCVFIVMGGIVLHIKWSHVKSALARAWRALRWLMAAFHLTRGAMPASDTEDVVVVGTEDKGEKSVVSRIRTSRRRVAAEPSVPAPAKEARAPRSRSVAIATGAYELPDPAFLEKSGFGKNVITPELKRNAASLEDHFEEFGVYGKVVGIKPGPIVTLYEFEPDTGMRIAKITETVKDMTRAMATENMRIAHIPRTNFIGVEMVNLTTQTVRYRELVENPTFVNSKYKIPLALGVDIGGNPMYFDLAKMPHMLVAGRTGSGKSVFVQSIITSIVYHFTPDKCKLIIIDPKGVDFGFWDDVPHLITPIVKLDPAAAVNALKWAVREMEERYKQLQVLDARNIESYNEAAAAKRASGEKITRQVAVGTDEVTGELLFETQEVEINDMPYIVIIIDEVADLMALARKEVEACVQRIAQKARAAGIHLVMATQRPDATTITGVIKANFPTRISFQARSNIDSRTTLGEGGAENLLACGDMLFSEAGRVPVRIHGAFISDAELNTIGDFLRAQGAPEYAAGVTEGEEEPATAAPAPSAAEIRADKNADLYEQAKEIVIRDKKPTISYLQRRLGIGYNKAATFIERMEADGIVSAPDANNKRNLL